MDPAEAPRVIRSFAAAIETSRAGHAQVGIELSKGDVYRFPAVMPSGILHDMMLSTPEERVQLRYGHDLLLSLVCSEDRERLDKALHDTDRPINGQVVYDIASAVVEHYTGRPTTPSSSSEGGQQNNGEPSTGGAESAAATPSPSRRRRSSTSATAG